MTWQSKIKYWLLTTVKPAFMSGKRVSQRWSHFVTQPAKVDSLMRRMTHHEDAETVFG